MESIKELRQICQATRPSIFSDPLSRIYYFISIYFTKIFLILKMNANQVTILSGIISILGGILISSSSIIVVLIGALCFHFFAILDMSDGEVARYRGEGGLEGHYLDWLMHFIAPTALVIGLFISSQENLENDFLLFLGLIALVVPIFSKTIQNAGWTVIVWTLLRNKKKGSYSLLDTEVLGTSKKQRTKFYKILRLIFTSPVEDRWASFLIFIFPLIEIFLSLFNIVFFDYRFFWLIYLGLIGPIYLFFKVRELYSYRSLPKGYNKIINPNHKVVLPKDDFL